MEFYFYLLLFVMGTVTGSFYITLSGRILKYFYSQERKKYNFTEKLYYVLIYGNRCDHCQHKIDVIATIPVIGYFLSLGKCRYCKKKIALKYPIIEMFFGLLLVFVFFISQNIILSFALTFLSGHLLVSSITDWKHYSLDYENLFFIVLFGIVVLYETDGMPTWEHFLLFIGFLTFYFILWFFFRNSIGFGDVLFSPFYALIIGHPWWILYLNTAYASALISALLMRKKGESIKKKVIPMGAFLSWGLFASLLGKIYYIFRGYNG